MISPSIFTDVINGYLPEPHSSLLNGILFGTPIKGNYEFYQDLKAVGLVHIVVLSGMNITFLGAILAKMTSSLSKHVSILLSIFSIIIFVLFVGPQAPIVRAAIMGCLTFVSILLGKKSIALYSLITSGILIALFIPQWISTISFQLSFAATLGIILLGGTRDTMIPTKNTIVRYVRENLRITLAAQIFTTPIISFYFHQISYISPVSNILVAWMIEPLMIFGFVTSILGVIWEPLGRVFSYICYGLLVYFVTVVEFLAHIPYSYMQF
jgi:competence protein ComEC